MSNTFVPSRWHLMYHDYTNQPLAIPEEPVCDNPEQALQRMRAFMQAHGENPTFTVVLRDGSVAEEPSNGVFIRQIPQDPNEETLDWHVEHLEKALNDTKDPLADFLKHEKMR